MEIVLKEMKISKLVDGYSDKGEQGVRGFDGKLNIRPPYQREFIYGQKQRDAVIQTVLKEFPLNTMYWAVGNDEFELMDGQQRTVSICKYVNGDFSVLHDGEPKFFDNLPVDLRDRILNYKLSIYVCDGTDSEKLDWFKIINIAGEKLTDQELRNAIFTGPWLADAKKWFSKSGAPAAAIGSKYVKGVPIRQAYLETALDWLSKGHISEYMGEHQDDPNANELWTYFRNVIDWVELTFPVYRKKEMLGVSWGPLFDAHGDEKHDVDALERQISVLMMDRDVTRKSGIYEYVLNGNENALSIRAFDANDRREAYERQMGICPVCNEHFELDEMEADHIDPWSKGGKTIPENCKMLCKPDNRRKSGK